MRSFFRRMSFLLGLLFFGQLPYAQTTLTVDASQPGVAISPTMYGIFFEDINFGADGGLYAELVKNRSFEFDHPLRGWQILKEIGTDGRVLNLRDENRPRNPRYLRLQVNKAGEGFGLRNEGFRGMGIRAGAGYRFSMQARQVSGDIKTVRIELIDSKNNVIATGRLTGFSRDWDSYKCDIISNQTEAKAQLNLWVEGEGELDIDMVSLFPEDTWLGRENGLRADLVQLLVDLKPGFLRFPGGCIVEGFDLSQRYQWKHTVGPINERVLNINRWNFEFKHRPAPDYYQSYGLGFYEYFLLAEDLGAEPMPILNCGMACQFNTAELAPMDHIEPYIQDALDLIEFANGSTDSEWGRLRADMGHPEPFYLKMLGVGNEQWGPQYIERYKVFARAIKEKYPDIQLIAATGSDATIFPNGQQEIDYLWSQWRELEPEFVDEHFYRHADWFLSNTEWYDDYPRTGPKLFVGEWAAQDVGVASPDNRNTWKTALAEAAFMTGLERNADVVRMSCYAPLFGHEEAWQWRPDLIWFDNLTSYGSANYYVQKLFSLNPGTHTLSCELDDKSNLFASATWDEPTKQIILKIVNAAEEGRAMTINLKGNKVDGSAAVLVLTSPSLRDENSISEPQKIVPQEFTLAVTNSFSYKFPPISLTVLRIPTH